MLVLIRAIIPVKGVHISSKSKIVRPEYHATCKDEYRPTLELIKLIADVSTSTTKYLVLTLVLVLVVLSYQ